jgi:hypothetical protein
MRGYYYLFARKRAAGPLSVFAHFRDLHQLLETRKSGLPDFTGATNQNGKNIPSWQ